MIQTHVKHNSGCFAPFHVRSFEVYDNIVESIGWMHTNIRGQVPGIHSGI